MCTRKQIMYSDAELLNDVIQISLVKQRKLHNCFIFFSAHIVKSWSLFRSVDAGWDLLMICLTRFSKYSYFHVSHIIAGCNIIQITGGDWYHYGSLGQQMPVKYATTATSSTHPQHLLSMILKCFVLGITKFSPNVVEITTISVSRQYVLKQT